MLMKMGWAGSGTGLGSKGQGIDSPISGGEVRDRKDMYKVSFFNRLHETISNTLPSLFAGCWHKPQ